MGCDKVQGLYIAVYPVSIHAPTWGATENAQVDVPYWEFQSTHPHGVRHGNVPKSFRTCIVSIHAPTWGATNSHKKPRCKAHVSIHAPTWGATNVLPPPCIMFPCFNPHTHMGCDKYVEDKKEDVQQFQSTHPHGVRLPVSCFMLPWYKVSIHAPTWGATSPIASLMSSL